MLIRRTRGMILRQMIFTSIAIVSCLAQTYLGNYSRMTNDGRTVVVFSDSSALRLLLYSKDIVRIDILPNPGSRIDTSFVVIKNPVTNVLFEVNESDSFVTASTSQIRVGIQKYPLRLMVADSTGRIMLSEHPSGGFSTRNDSRSLRFTMNAADHFYGTGERGTALDKRGQKFVSYNTQIGGYSDSLPTMNLNVPLVTTIGGYALYIDNTYRGEFDFGVTDTTAFSYAAEGGEISYYVIAAPTIPAQLERYSWLTGRQPLPPRWIFGYTQSKNRYVNEQEARSIVQTMRTKKFPCDAIVLDLAWFKHMGDISWDTSAWPNHDTMITDFLAQGMKTVLITEPYIIEPSQNFAEADSNGFLAKDIHGKTQLLEKWWSCGGCNSSLLDMTNPKAQKWWWNKHPAAFGKYVSGIWTDLGEPEKHPESMVHYLGSAVKIHNIFNLLWAKTISDGFTSLHPNERVVNLTRSGFAGIQRYGVLPWSGDVARSFGGLAVQLPMMLNMGMSGIAYHNSDIGGYARNPTSPELYIRWMQYGVFCPITRAHGAGEVVKGSATEPWQFGDEAERICREYLELRYKLLPYNYTLAFQNYSTGMPLARPLVWTDPQLTNESSSYMWGEAFLVSPVVKAGERTKKVVLPKGEWVNYWTDELVTGSQEIVTPAPLDRMPIFVKAGSIVPMGPVMDYSDQRPLDTLTLHVYPDGIGKNASSYTLYEDDGKSLEYQHGAYATATFSQQIISEKKTTKLLLTASPSRGEYKGKLQHRTFTFVVHNVDGVSGDITVNGTAIKRASKQNEFLLRTNGFYFDPLLRRLTVQILSRTDSANEVKIVGIRLQKSSSKGKR